MTIRTALLVFALVSLTACSRAPDDQRIRSHIKAMQEAIENHSPRNFLQFVSPDFSGNDNTVDRNGLGNILRVEVLRDDKVGVTLGPIDVEVQGDRATVDVVATFTGGSGGLIPEHGSVYTITSGWRREGKDWICYVATWEQKL